MWFSTILFYSLLVAAHSTDENVKPNIIMFLTDDQDDVMNGMGPMKNVHQFIGSKGISFTNSYTTSPICCPSRASILSGMYPHNHMTRNNSISGGCNGEKWRSAVEPKTFAAIMKESGYSTFYAGKYLNQYGVPAAGGPHIVPPGWSEWHGLVGNSVYYNYTLSNNGVPTFSSDLYLTDVIRHLALNYIEEMKTKETPFLMVLSPPAPHQPFTPAARHEGVYRNTTVDRLPNFNVVAKNKHWLMTMPPSPLPEDLISELDRVYRSRWESLLAVDEMVADVVNALEISDKLQNTYLIYTSDNGYHIGQFSQVYDKRQPYESDIKVPLLISGPGITKSTRHDPVLNIDLAPTILSLAGLDPPKSMDGSVIELLNSTEVAERYMLIEYHGEGSTYTVEDECPWKYDYYLIIECKMAYDCKCQDSKNNTFACVRHISQNVNLKFCLFDDKECFREAYDLNQDPYELTNVIDEMFPYLRNWYTWQLATLLTCKGSANCSNTELEVPPKFRTSRCY